MFQNMTDIGFVTVPPKTRHMSSLPLKLVSFLQHVVLAHFCQRLKGIFPFEIFLQLSKAFLIKINFCEGNLFCIFPGGGNSLRIYEEWKYSVEFLKSSPPELSTSNELWTNTLQGIQVCSRCFFEGKGNW